jgi:protein-tyrosine phosphatase
VTPPLVDIHCHLIPGIDDGAQDLGVALEMARMAAAEGVGTIVATPHQLGAYAHNHGDLVRQGARDLNQEVAKAGIPLGVLPGGDVRIDGDVLRRLAAGDALTLGDHGRHVLLELPHELYFPLEGLLRDLAKSGLVGVLSHPERNAGLIAEPQAVSALVDSGCLMQVTAGSFAGAFGPASKGMAEWMLAEGLIHFVATDAHGARARRPRLRRAFDRVAELAGDEAALDLCCHHPAAVAAGRDVPAGRRARFGKPARWRRLFSRSKAA